jgi:hypothetical protein
MVAKNRIGGRVGMNDLFILSQGKNRIEGQVADRLKVFCLPVESLDKFLWICEIGTYANGEMPFF